LTDAVVEAIVSLGQGDAPLIEAPALSRSIGARLYLKFEGTNLTASFKECGITLALSRAVASGDRAVCASTGKTAATASAYSARAGISCFVVVPVGKSALSNPIQASRPQESRVARERGFPRSGKSR
jgi:threonine synthase